MKKMFLFITFIFVIIENNFASSCLLDTNAFGIFCGRFKIINDIEHCLNLASFEKMGNSIGFIRLINMDYPAKVVDICQGNDIRFKIYTVNTLPGYPNDKTIDNKLKVSKKSFNLVKDEMKSFQDSVKKLGVETMYNLNCTSTLDGKRLYVVKVLLLNYNMFMYRWSEDCSETRQHRFVSYISKLIKEKTGIDF